MQMLAINMKFLSRFQSIQCNFSKFNKFQLFNPGRTPKTLCIFNKLEILQKVQLRPYSAMVRNMYFSEMMEFRHRQASSSILMELASTEDSNYAASFCSDFGKVKKFIQYSGELGGFYLLVEYEREESAKLLLRSCQFRNLTDSIPTLSRFLRYEKRKKKRKLDSNHVIHVENQQKISRAGLSREPSEMIREMYETERQSDLSIRKRFLFACVLKEMFSGIFPYCAALPFGSSVNGFGKDSSDLDLMIRLYPSEVIAGTEAYFHTKTCVGDIRILQQRAISFMCDTFRTCLPGVSYVQKIMHARVPILKFKQKILELDCDLSVNNMSAVYMSELLYFCGEVDDRVRPLVTVIKKWAKESSITYETAGTWITNFSLTLMTLFFLQNRPVPILPPLMNAVDLSACHETALSWEVKYKQSPSHWTALAKNNTERLDVLLREFFRFVTEFPFQKELISVLSGVSTSKKENYHLSIEYPMEEGMNVSKNVSLNELQNFCHLGGISLRHLEENNSSNQRGIMSLLGLPELKQFAKKIDVNALYNESAKIVAKGKI